MYRLKEKDAAHVQLLSLLKGAPLLEKSYKKNSSGW